MDKHTHPSTLGELYMAAIAEQPCPQAAGAPHALIPVDRPDTPSGYSWQTLECSRCKQIVITNNKSNFINTQTTTT